MAGTRRTYTREFKTEAVRRVVPGLGLRPGTYHAWRSRPPRQRNRNIHCDFQLAGSLPGKHGRKRTEYCVRVTIVGDSELALSET